MHWPMSAYKYGILKVLLLREYSNILGFNMLINDNYSVICPSIKVPV